MMKTVKLENDGLSVRFEEAGGGFPTSLGAHESDGGRVEVLRTDRPMLSLRTGDGHLLVPTLAGVAEPCRFRNGSAQVVFFPKLGWIQADTGAPQHDLFLSLHWEFHPTGAVFCDMFLYYGVLDVPALHDCRLSVPLDLSAFDACHWSVTGFPDDLPDASMAQIRMPERHLPWGERRTFDDALFSAAGFNAVRTRGPSLYCEAFLEGDNTLFNRSGGRRESSVETGGGTARLTWNFQPETCSGNRRPLHWRNRWGLVVRPAQTVRRHPPMAMYQYIDNFQRFPTPEEVDEIVNAGAQVVILHDCWRLDTQNDGIPYDEGRLRAMIDRLHRRGVRVALYGRGNEISAREDAIPWFDYWLRKDFDGLYLDYGGPFGFWSRDENHPGGRLGFREYYLTIERLRRRVGERGLLYVHTGPFYSGLASGFFDGYVSGEGERGILIRGREEHEYFTMASASPGTVWTANFPEYGSPRMIPFLAADAETPHIPLGCQTASTALHHPPVPGINDQVFVPLLNTDFHVI